MELHLVNTIIKSYPNAWSHFLSCYDIIFNKPDPQTPTGKETIGKNDLEKIAKTLLIKTNPRFLYDFFDDLKLFLFILPEDNTFKILVHGITGLETGERFFNRQTAEQQGFVYCFELLEDLLLSQEG